MVILSIILWPKKMALIPLTSYEESQELINSYPDNQIDTLYH